MIDMVFDYLTIDVFGGKKKRNKLDSMNSISVQLYMFFLQLANRQIVYKNLPDDIEPYTIERQLFFYGQSVFFQKGGVNILIPCANNGSLNLYAQPIRVVPIGMAGYSFPEVWVRDEYELPEMKLLHSKDAIIVKNNELSMSTYAQIKPFVEKLSFIWESLGINNGLSRIKYLLKANKDLAPTIMSEINSIIGSRTGIAVISDKKSVMSDLEKLDFGIAYNPKDYWYDFDKTFNFILSLLGIKNNSESQKKERMVSDEVDSNEELVDLALQTRLEFREYAFKQINKMFGTNIQVEARELHIEKDLPPKKDDDKNEPPFSE